MLCSLCSIANKILAHVIWKSFSFHFIKILKTSQHFWNSGCKMQSFLFFIFFAILHCKYALCIGKVALIYSKPKAKQYIVVHSLNGLLFPLCCRPSAGLAKWIHPQCIAVWQWRCVFWQVRYLKIIEKSGYQALPWVRYITQNGGKTLSHPLSLLSFSIFVIVFHSVA